MFIQRLKKFSVVINQVSSGTFDYESAYLNAIKDLSSKGLGVINYRT